MNKLVFLLGLTLIFSGCSTISNIQRPQQAANPVADYNIDETHKITILKRGALDDIRPMVKTALKTIGYDHTLPSPDPRHVLIMNKKASFGEMVVYHQQPNQTLVCDMRQEDENVVIDLYLEVTDDIINKEIAIDIAMIADLIRSYGNN